MLIELGENRLDPLAPLRIHSRKWKIIDIGSRMVAEAVDFPETMGVPLVLLGGRLLSEGMRDADCKFFLPFLLHQKKKFSLA